MEKNSLYHLACPFAQEVYQAKTNKNPAKIKAKGAIVPHHLLARNLIAEVLDQLSSNYQTVILIGPNHLDLGLEKIQISKREWRTQFGTLEPDKNLIISLEKQELTRVKEENFDIEHSICGLVSFVKIYFPQATIVPLILKSNTSSDQSKKLALLLSKNCHNCLMVASVDFSHGVSQQQAEENDQKSIEILRGLDEKALDEVVVDSKPTLETFLYYLKEKKGTHSHLINHSDAAKLSGKQLQEVTSYITMVFE